MTSSIYRPQSSTPANYIQGIAAASHQSSVAGRTAVKLLNTKDENILFNIHIIILAGNLILE